MREKVFIISVILIVLALLVGLNAATFVSEKTKPDSELSPNRSTYHPGPTGTRAFYDFLSESGHRVMRWREPPEKLLGPTGQQVRTFVVVGRTQLRFDDEQANGLLEWIRRGGRLVLIDRAPQAELLPDSGSWSFETTFGDFSGFGVDPGNVQAMTGNVHPLRPIQPTRLTRDVEAVMPSRLASKIKIVAKINASDPLEVTPESEWRDEDDPAGSANNDSPTSEETSPAPVVHLGDLEGALLADYPHGRGRIILLSDPYVVSNGGLALSDNLQLALNMVTGPGDLVAFDEFHQGRGITENALIGYFSGTPVMALCAQIAFLLLLVVWSRGRRFARPLPLPQIDRRSKLEFVASMAELQQRSRAFDLAIENIYTRTRKVLARYAGVDYNTPRSEIAARVAARSTLNAHQLETLMRQCEETINGTQVNWRQAIDLVKRLRNVERTLGLRMRSRDVRQAAENI